MKKEGEPSAQNRLRMKPRRSLWFSKGFCAILIAGQEQGFHARWTHSPKGGGLALFLPNYSMVPLPWTCSLHASDGNGPTSDDGASGKEAPMIIMPPASGDQRFP